MVALLSLAALFLPALLARTSPVSVELAARDQVFDHAQRAQYGVSVRSDVSRFVVKYANAQRWKPSTAVSVSQGASLLQRVCIFLPHQILIDEPHTQDLPPACPQSGLDSTSEDCLYMVVYVPSSICAGSNAPTLFWFASHSIFPCRMYSQFLGSMVDLSRVVLRAILQSMALTSPLQLNPSSRFPNTGSVQWVLIGYYTRSLAYLCTVWLHGSQQRDQPGRQRYYQRFDGLESRGSYDRWIGV